MFSKGAIDDDAEREAMAISKLRKMEGRKPRHAKPGKMMVGSKFDPPTRNYDELWAVLMRKERNFHV